MARDGNDLNVKGVFDSMDPNMTRVFLPWALRHPRYLRGGYRLVKGYRKASSLRMGAKEEGVLVPPFLILSITRQCNLHCAGCYSSAVETPSHDGSDIETRTAPSIGMEHWERIIEEARGLGVYGFILAGGEPFLFPGLLDLCAQFKDRFFLIVTNGTTIKERDLKALGRLSNVAVIVSLEGGEAHTDGRRGEGVFKKVIDNIGRLSWTGTVTGISVTITRSNHRYWMEDGNIDHLIDKGVRIGIFIEYIPTTRLDEAGPDDGDHALILTSEEREDFRRSMLRYREQKRIYIIHSPGDEEPFGGCVSAGRGFAHVTPSGDLTPCPVSNIATHNLTTSSMREALASPLFKEIRDNEHLLETEGLPCALFAHPKEVDELARSVGAYRTFSSSMKDRP